MVQSTQTLINLKALEWFGHEELTKVPLVRCNKLMEMDLRRLAAVTAANGGFTIWEVRM